MSNLAIVIPAYKIIFFDQALLSIANQTNKDFTLYIGDDCSPDHLNNVVEKYKHKISIVYKHFDENLGKGDLVAHWERCIDMVCGEEWIWLFSDDDMMDSTCVEHFYQTLKHYPNYDIYHFNLTKIDHNNNKVVNFHAFPDKLSSEEFLIYKLQIGYFSTVIEYVFRKEHFFLQQRFQNFDLAWCSDDATWIKMAKSKGIRNIDHSKVYWRTSLYNVSTNNWDVEIIKRKFYSRIKFAEWIIEESKEGKLNIEIPQARKLLTTWFIKSIKLNINCLSFKLLKESVVDFCRVVDMENSSTLKIIFLSLYKVSRYHITIHNHTKHLKL